MKRYYTPPSIAKLMVELIQYIPRTAVDICVGSWNLLSAAKTKWQNITLYGIDIDNKSKILTNDSYFRCIDGRAFALECLKKNDKFSLVLANPPFGKDNIECIDIYKELPGYKEIKTVALRRIEATMLLANLSLIENNGYLVAIVPRTIIKGEWSMPLRKYIANKYQLKTIISLPRHAFGSEIYTAILVIENSNVINVTNIYNTLLIDNKYELYYNNVLSNQIVKEGFWMPMITKDLKKDYFKIERGNIKNDILVNNGKKPVMHSTDILKIRNGQWEPTKYLPIRMENTNILKTANEGDIVVIRVGRNSGVSARINYKSKIPVSNCLFIISTKNRRYQDLIWEIMNSSLYFSDLPELLKGVSTNYLTLETLKGYLEQRMGGVIC